MTLRGQGPSAEIIALVGVQAAEQLSLSDHMPAAVALKLAALLRDACENGGMDRHIFMQLDRERALLIEHVGACERVMKTPLALAYSIKIRRFIALFLLVLPLALIHKLGTYWLVPSLTMLVAYPLLSLDQLGMELENPVDTCNLSHLPLDAISATIERNVIALAGSAKHEAPLIKREHETYFGPEEAKYGDQPRQVTSKTYPALDQLGAWKKGGPVLNRSSF